jgi:membrane-bound ClpP family serine protease
MVGVKNLTVSKDTFKRILILSVDEIVVLVFLLWGLPALGVRLPIGAVVAITAGLVARSVITYRLAKPVLVEKPRAGFDNMRGLHGKVLEPVDQEGLVIVQGEVWKARCADENLAESIQVGMEIVVTDRKGLILYVRNCKKQATVS